MTEGMHSSEPGTRLDRCMIAAGYLYNSTVGASNLHISSKRFKPIFNDLMNECIWISVTTLSSRNFHRFSDIVYLHLRVMLYRGCVGRVRGGWGRYSA